MKASTQRPDFVSGVRRLLTNRPKLTNFLFDSGGFVSFSKAERPVRLFVNFKESELLFDSGSLIPRWQNIFAGILLIGQSTVNGRIPAVSVANYEIWCSSK